MCHNEVANACVFFVSLKTVADCPRTPAIRRVFVVATEVAPAQSQLCSQFGHKSDPHDILSGHDSHRWLKMRKATRMDVMLRKGLSSVWEKTTSLVRQLSLQDMPAPSAPHSTSTTSESRPSLCSGCFLPFSDVREEVSNGKGRVARCATHKSKCVNCDGLTVVAVHASSQYQDLIGTYGTTRCQYSSTT